jgi:hypothetical protein
MSTNPQLLNSIFYLRCSTLHSHKGDYGSCHRNCSKKSGSWQRVPWRRWGFAAYAWYDLTATRKGYVPGEAVQIYPSRGCDALSFLNTTVAADKSSPRFLYWVIFFAGLVGTPIYLRFAQQVAVPLQLIISTVAFAVWAFALGGPFSEIPGYKPIYGAVLLPIFTFFVASITPATSTQSRS